MEGVNVVVAVELLLQEELENDRPHHRVYRRRLLRPRSSFLELTDQQCVERYRFDKATIQDLCLQLQPLLQAHTRRNYPMPVHLKVTTALAFLATGSFQSALQDNMRQFYNVAQFPSVIGVVDCTHIAFRPPRADEASYRNRKAFHSMNMQVVCNAQREILDMCARYPGSTHDAYKVQHCGLHRRATQGHFNGAWLLAEEEYNRRHRATRSIIERTFGQLKNRFRCLDRLRGQLLYRPEKVAQIFVACCMLHNLAVRKPQPLPDPPQQQLQQPPDGDDDEPLPPPQHRVEHSASQEGFNARHCLIQTHFL
uniref:Nuclease HARBI1 n=1 Tax=Geotrypetes seraphini TaxID=260995 RepID=A0A6P8PP56_GEOSA|nr:putative nuclease HARBI1 [Geotrypetes seraphini]